MNAIKVSRIDTAAGPVPLGSRRDFYTVCLLTGPRPLQCADQQLALDGPCLLLGKPPGALGEAEATARQTGYACRFTEAFFQENASPVSQQQRALFSGPAPRTFALRSEQATYLTSLFQKMLAEQQTTYVFKHELLRTCLRLIIHEALRLRAPAPKRFFRYYFQQYGFAGELRAGWRGRPRLG